MRAISVISAAIMLASSSVSASNDPRECEGKLLDKSPMTNDYNIDQPLLQCLLSTFFSLLNTRLYKFGTYPCIQYMNYEQP